MIKYPAEGYLYVGTDFHGDYDAFLRWIVLSNAHAYEKKVKPKFLVLGDSIDNKANPLSEGDRKIIDFVGQSKISHLRGNHEETILRIYSSKDVDDKIAKSYNFIKRMKDDDQRLINSFPYTAMTENKILFSHCGLPSNLSLEKLANPSEAEKTQFVLNAFADEERISKNLENVGCRYLISGHTPLAMFSGAGRFPDCIKYGIVEFGRKIVFTSNEGFEQGRRAGLCINLEKEYTDLVEELNEEKGILYLD